MDRDHEDRRSVAPAATGFGAHDAALRALRALADSSVSGDPADVVTAFVRTIAREFPVIESATITPSAEDDPSPWSRFIPVVERDTPRDASASASVERIPIRLGRAIPLSFSVRFAPGAGPDAGERSALRSLGPIVSLFADLALASAESRGIVRMRTRLVESLASGSSIAAESIRQLIFAEPEPEEPGERAPSDPSLDTESVSSAPPDGWPFRAAEPRFDLREVVGRMRGWLGAFLASRGSALRITLGPRIPQSIPGTAELFGTALFELLEALTSDRPRSPVLVRIDGSPDGTELLFEAGFEAPPFTPASPAVAPGKDRPLWLAPLFFLRRGGRFDEQLLAGSGPRSIRGRMPCAGEALPSADAVDAPEPLPVRTTAARERELPDAGLVLVVDDEVYARYTIRCLLEREGYRVETACDGEEGLAAARAARPAIVIMDLSMPRCDGLEAAKRMRADESLRTLPLLAMTARSKETAVREALAAGFDGIIQKPFFLPELLSVVRHWLGERPTAAQPGI